MAAPSHGGLCAPCTLASVRGLGGLSGKETHPPTRVRLSSWEVPPSTNRAAGAKLQPQPTSVATFSLEGCPHTPSPMPRTLLGLGRGVRVAGRSPHSELERSGLTSCSAPAVTTSLERASEFIGEDRLVQAGHCTSAGLEGSAGNLRQRSLQQKYSGRDRPHFVCRPAKPDPFNTKPKLRWPNKNLRGLTTTRGSSGEAQSGGCNDSLSFLL